MNNFLRYTSARDLWQVCDPRYPEDDHRFVRAEFARKSEARDWMDAHPQPSSEGVAFDSRELATVLAALRYWQHTGCADDPNKRPDEIHDIAVSCEGETSLCGEDVDELCERLNLGDYEVRPPATPRPRNRPSVGK